MIYADKEINSRSRRNA